MTAKPTPDTRAKSSAGGTPSDQAAASDELVETVDLKEPRVANALRLHLVLPPRSAERLKWLKDVTEAPSLAEVIRNAIQLYEAVIREHEDGNKLMIERDGKIERYNLFY